LPGSIVEVVLGIIFAKGAPAGPGSSYGGENGKANENEFELFHDYIFRRLKRTMNEMRLHLNEVNDNRIQQAGTGKTKFYIR
jgi:hypothetical protein